MGVKTPITIDRLRAYLDVTTLTPTHHGVRDTVYIIDDAFVLKIFEQSSYESVEAERRLLQLCRQLPVARSVGELLTVEEKPSLLYEKCVGSNLQRPIPSEIHQIGAFLKAFHSLTQGKHSTNENLFERSRLYRLIEQTGHRPFFEVFERLPLSLQNDGIIHGDLFTDNVSFQDGRLSCVYDFGEACNGDFCFDLAVASLSWCRNDEDLSALLEGYGADLERDAFDSYVSYAALYYSVTRFLAGRNFDDLWEKIQ